MIYLMQGKDCLKNVHNTTNKKNCGKKQPWIKTDFSKLPIRIHKQYTENKLLLF